MQTMKHLFEMVQVCLDVRRVDNNVMDIDHATFVLMLSENLFHQSLERCCGVFKEKGKTKNSYSPEAVMKAVFSILAGSISTCQYPLF